MRRVRRAVIILLLLGLSWLTAYWSILYIRPYKGVIGNLCEITADNPSGYCYEMLPSGGFPFTFMWDNGGVSVVGRLSLIEDRFVFAPFLANWGVYLVVYSVIFWLVLRKK